MDTRGFHRDVDEVRIIIGRKFGMIVKLDNDPDELIFNEELVEHKSEGPLMQEVPEHHVHLIARSSQRS